MIILYASSEAVPYVKTGGLADVCGTLPVHIRNMGHEVCVFIPKYKVIPREYTDSAEHICDFYVQIGWRNQYCGIDATECGGVRFYLVDNLYYFGRDYVYGDTCADECERFAFFNKAVLEAAVHMGIRPDIIHCNDWQCGFIPYLARNAYRDAFSATKTIFTIHNIHYQGIFPFEWVNDFLSVPDSDMECMEYYGNISFMKCGITCSDEITTVSPTYAREIRDSEIGEGLQGVLSAKGEHLHGILNGIDTSVYNPYDDKYVEHHFAAYQTEGKAMCKESLQYQLWLDRDKDAPLMGIVSRLTEQKGLYLVEHTWERLLGMGVQLAVVGTGDAHFESFFRWLSARFGGRVAARIEYSEMLSHRTYAGCDIFLMPSRTEPCGLAQMIAMRYGTLPVVHETGGLTDSVIPFNTYTGEGTGFTFYDYNEEQFINAAQRAVSAYRDRQLWHRLMNRAMTQNFSWDASAAEYAHLYDKIKRY